MEIHKKSACEPSQLESWPICHGNMHILGIYYLSPTTGGLVEFLQYVSYFTFNQFMQCKLQV